ncbi:hypothetical protein [Hyphomonas adhaerens]|nr:hypothetical protein [Hyphomonas adhaerens]|tara:strand:+ start:1087 stop:1443 length:357 start_codon:yes stop_codon:yes gene_type:complete
MLRSALIPVRETPMRTITLAGLAFAAALTGCGGSKDSHDQLVDTCIAEGEAPETCACIVDAMEAKLSPDLFKRSAVAISREKRPVGEYILSLSDDEKMQFFDAEQEMETCELSVTEDE